MLMTSSWSLVTLVWKTKLWSIVIIMYNVDINDSKIMDIHKTKEKMSATSGTIWTNTSVVIIVIQHVVHRPFISCWLLLGYLSAQHPYLCIWFFSVTRSVIIISVPMYIFYTCITCINIILIKYHTYLW